jgi:hypothetical protein
MATGYWSGTPKIIDLLVWENNIKKDLKETQ